METALKPLCIWCWITVYSGFALLGHLVIGSVLMCQIKNNKKRKTVHSQILAESNTLGLRPGGHFEVTCLRVCALAGSLLCIDQFPSCVFCLPMDNAQTLPFFKTNLLFANEIHVFNAS